MIFTLILLLGWTPLTRGSDLGEIEKSCSFLLAPASYSSREVLANFVKLPSGGELFVRIQRPRSRTVKGWYFLIHGLLESHRSYDGVTRRLLAEGYGVVRMDLRGFARSLHREIQNTENEGRSYRSSSVLDYRVHVQDLIELLDVVRKKYGVERPHVVGHSMGGGLTMALLATAEGAELAGPRATVIAPYVYRLDHYMVEKFLTLGLPLPTPIQTLDRWLPAFAKAGPEFLADTFLSDPHMRNMFEDYFDSVLLQRELQVPRAQLRLVRRHHIEAAMASVKGMRGLNALDKVDQLIEGIRIDLVYGDTDPVVDRRQARQLGNKLARRGGDVWELSTGHLILDEAPEVLVERLIGE